MHFVNFIATNNWISGLAWKETFLNHYAFGNKTDGASMYKRSIVIGHIDGAPELGACGNSGIELPWSKFSFSVDDVAFYNFDAKTPGVSSTDEATLKAMVAPRRDCIAVRPCYGTNAFDCGAITYFSNIKWDNSQRKMSFPWEHAGAIWDRDGTFLESTPNRFLVAKSDAYDPAYCKVDKSRPPKYFGHPSMVCEGEVNGEQLRFHRFMFNQANPITMEGSMAVFEGRHGTAKSPFRNCRPRGRGWMVMLQGKEEYRMYFETHEHISNISFTGDIDDFEEGDYLTIRHDLPERIDYAEVKGKDTSGEKLNITQWPTGNKDEILKLNTYDYMIDRAEAPFSVYYSFNGNGVPINDVKKERQGIFLFKLRFLVWYDGNQDSRSERRRHAHY